MEKSQMKTGQMSRPLAEIVAQQLGEQWALHASAEELQWIAADLAVQFLHGANREDVVDSLHGDASAGNAASIAVDATLHAIKVIEDAGGNIDPDLPAHTLLKAVEYTMEIHHAINHPFAEIGTVESVRFLAKRVKHIAEKLYQTQGHGCE